MNKSVKQYLHIIVHYSLCAMYTERFFVEHFSTDFRHDVWPAIRKKIPMFVMVPNLVMVTNVLCIRFFVEHFYRFQT